MQWHARRGSSVTSVPASISSSSKASPRGRRRTVRLLAAEGAAHFQRDRVCRIASLARDEEDRAVVARQIGREPRAFRRVVVRCPFGRPAVAEQEPFDRNGAPFPTTYWLTCPHAVANVSRLEAAGGVERWTRMVEQDPQLRASLARANERQRALRPELDLGI